MQIIAVLLVGAPDDLPKGTSAKPRLLLKLFTLLFHSVQAHQRSLLLGNYMVNLVRVKRQKRRIFSILLIGQALHKIGVILQKSIKYIEFFRHEHAP